MNLEDPQGEAMMNTLPGEETNQSTLRTGDGRIAGGNVTAATFCNRREKGTLPLCERGYDLGNGWRPLQIR